MSDNKIKVMLVDDSVIIRKYATQVLESIPAVELIGTAPNGKIGLQKLFILKPDVVILDIEMPEMTGIEFLKYLKENVPASTRPFVIMFSSLVAEGSSATFEALANGASDFITKPDGQIAENLEYVRKEFELKIKGLYQARYDAASIMVKPAAMIHEKTAGMSEATAEGVGAINGVIDRKKVKPDIIAVGSSTGGPVAIRKILETLGPIPVPMVIAQHMPAGFTDEFAKNLSGIFHRDVREAVHGETLRNGVIYISPGGNHSKVLKDSSGFVFKTDPNNYDGFFFKPSVDIFFRSILDSSGKNTLAVILSGMGKDGSEECVSLRKAGALVVAQNKETSVVWGMPGNSVKNGGVDLVLPIEAVGDAINRVFLAAK